MSQKKITNLILESLPLTKLAKVLVSPQFKVNVANKVLERVETQLSTLKYLAEHFEGNTKLSNPYLQMVSQHRVLIEQILNGIFLESNSAALTESGQRYEALLYICDQVEKLKQKEIEDAREAAVPATVAEEMATN